MMSEHVAIAVATQFLIAQNIANDGFSEARRVAGGAPSTKLRIRQSFNN